MKANPKFMSQPKHFWANVRTISQAVGYTERGAGVIKIPTISDIKTKFSELGLSYAHLVNGNQLTEMGTILIEYFKHRADSLNLGVKINLMNKDSAEQLFNEVFDSIPEDQQATLVLPMNKQKGDKKKPAFLTGLVNMLIHMNKPVNLTCDYDPRSLTTVTFNELPLRTLSRRVDGAFPSTINPVAIWEIKEYYYTTTFGSRVADGVYETLLDGMELEELREHEGIKVHHVLVLDDYFTWWECGRSYLCRIIDMLHMGYVDEVIFGKEVIERIPALTKEWVAIEQAKHAA